MKTCSCCKLEKSLEEYSKNKSTKDGFQTVCKICGREYSRLNRLKNLEVRRKYDREYCQRNRARKKPSILEIGDMLIRINKEQLVKEINPNDTSGLSKTGIKFELTI